MSAITIDNNLVHYEVLGRGRPVILLHGWLGSWRYWIPTMQQLGMKYRVYALDLWGFGDTEKDPQRYSFASQVKLLMDFMEKLGIGKAAIVGHALGAGVAITFTRQFPERAPRVMLISPPLYDMGGIGAPIPAPAPLPAPTAIPSLPFLKPTSAPTAALPTPAAPTPAPPAPATTTPATVAAKPVPPANTSPTPSQPAAPTPASAPAAIPALKPAPASVAAATSSPTAVSVSAPPAPVAAPAPPVTPAAPAAATPALPAPSTTTSPAAPLAPSIPSPATMQNPGDTLPRSPFANNPELLNNSAATLPKTPTQPSTPGAVAPARPSVPAPRPAGADPLSVPMPRPEVNPLVNLLSTINPKAALERHLARDPENLEKMRGEVEKMDNGILQRLAPTFQGINLAQQLSQLNSPVLLFHGREDAFFEPNEELINRIAALKGDGMFLPFITPEFRHFPMLEQTSKFNRLMTDFLDAPDLTNVGMKETWRRQLR